MTEEEKKKTGKKEEPKKPGFFAKLNFITLSKLS